MTIDAMGTQVEIAAKIVSHGADYLLPLKGNLTLLCHAATPSTRRAAFPAEVESIEQKGRQQAEALAGALGRADVCWTSPLLRARQTAAALGLAATIVPSLRDLDAGRWAGRTFDDLLEREPEAMAAWASDPGAAPHGGESILDLMRRVAAWLDGIPAADGHVIAVTHAAVMRAAVAHALAAGPDSFWRIDASPLSRAGFSTNGRRWTLRLLDQPGKRGRRPDAD